MENQKKIFLVEDNRTENMLLKLALNSVENIIIQSFANGKDLLAAMPEKPDIVVADMNLPDIHGYELVKIIREKYPNTRVVVVSAQKEMDMVAKLQELEVFNYLVKSEACITYLPKVIRDLITVMDNPHQNSEEF